MVIVFLLHMPQVYFSFINKITLFCRKNSSWTSKTVGWQVWARHQMAFICREFDQREKTGCQGTSRSGFAICCASSSAFLFAECKYIRTCVWLTARTKVHFCRSDAFSEELIKIQWPVDRQTVPSVLEEFAVSIIRVVQEEYTDFLGLPINLQWCWNLNANYFPAQRGFKFTVTLDSIMNAWWAKGGESEESEVHTVHRGWHWGDKTEVPSSSKAWIIIYHLTQCHITGKLESFSFHLILFSDVTSLIIVFS